MDRQLIKCNMDPVSAVWMVVGRHDVCLRHVCVPVKMMEGAGAGVNEALPCGSKGV